MKLEDIRVYNPKDDGWDFKTYKETCYLLQESKNKKALENFKLSLSKKVLDSKIDKKGITLNEFLYGPMNSVGEGYFFENKENIGGILIMDGRVIETYSHQKLIPENNYLKKIREEKNSIPLVYSRKIITE